MLYASQLEKIKMKRQDSSLIDIMTNNDIISVTHRITTLHLLLCIKSTFLSWFHWSCMLNEMSVTLGHTQKAYVKEQMSLHHGEQMGQSVKSPRAVLMWSGAQCRRLPRHPLTFKDVMRGT